MYFWSDDCLSCLCNLPHTAEEHNEEVERARRELFAQREALRHEFPEAFDEDDWEWEASGISE